jgi:hypothetical protein
LHIYAASCTILGGYSGLWGLRANVLPGPRADWRLWWLPTSTVTRSVVKVPDAEQSPEAEAIRTRVMDGYGERFRYIPGGNDSASDADVQSWMDAEGL